MDSMHWNITYKPRNINSAEIVPVILLGLEALLGVGCNLTAAIIYWQQKRGLFQNPGNVFTVSLIVNDLILSGITIPLVIAVETTDRSEIPDTISSLCLAARCTLLFSAVSSAAGSALVALDRADITIRPSKRFFQLKRAEISLLIVWTCSILSLVSPIWTSSSFNQKMGVNRTIYVDKQSFTSVQSQSSQTDESDFVTCNATCYSNFCAISKNEFVIRTTIQTVFFLCAALVIATTYSRILQSVKRRAVKRETKAIKMNGNLKTTNKKNKFFFLNRCRDRNTKEEKAPLSSSKDQARAQKIPTPICSTPISESKEYNQRSPQKCSLIKACGTENGASQEKTNETITESKKPESINEKPEIHPGRAHFASVALSVQAFIALKRMVKERAEVKRKKHRHLRRMTIAITLTFLICWTPFHILPYGRILAGETLDQPATCKLINCLNGEENMNVKSEEIFIRQPLHALNILFLWMFALASLSSIANPYLYSFSREKIRHEVCKTFCRDKSRHGCQQLKGEKCCKATFRQNTKQGTESSPRRAKLTSCNENRIASKRHPSRQQKV